MIEWIATSPTFDCTSPDNPCLRWYVRVKESKSYKDTGMRLEVRRVGDDFMALFISEHQGTSYISSIATEAIMQTLESILIRFEAELEIPSGHIAQLQRFIETGERQDGFSLIDPNKKQEQAQKAFCFGINPNGTKQPKKGKINPNGTKRSKKRAKRSKSSRTG